MSHLIRKTNVLYKSYNYFSSVHNLLYSSSPSNATDDILKSYIKYNPMKEVPKTDKEQRICNTTIETKENNGFLIDI